LNKTKKEKKETVKAFIQRTRAKYELDKIAFERRAIEMEMDLENLENTLKKKKESLREAWRSLLKTIKELFDKNPSW